MELLVREYQRPESILFNYEELKAEITEKTKMYETLVYTDDQIKDAKADKAKLNKLKKTLNDERIRLEKEYLEPFNDFKSKINEIIRIIDKPVAVIDKQVKEFEDKKKQDKYDAIKAMWEELEHPSELTLEKIYDSKWLNASTSMKNIKDTMVAAVEKFNQDMATLSNLPEFGFEATEVYKSTLDVNKAIYEAQRMSQIAKAKAEREAELERQRIEREERARRAEEEARKIAEQEVKQEYQTPDIVEVEEPEQVIESTDNSVNEKTWVSFSALLTTEDAYALKDFFNSRNIEFKAI
ncbi:DUF1351 domain-containing protein [Falcatimonas sp. MSJ-15]|uniref:DUF1351 domain-containing protein n=1 Tax=Falcatimonas sp. MSJ-15 TaxID=2841515 RepID=UPI001C1259C1|nr:DUF1351 domain-containing protein [Falcatimonas sp. MSJ-15]MBU5469153.1 DUF1351 domain-containing protein [Falcatimonas sp. MSJ-15]